MISSKKELQFFLMADRMVNRGEFTPSARTRIHCFFSPDYIMDFLVAMRHKAFYDNNPRRWLHKLVWNRRFRNLSIKLGFSIGSNVFGYGLLIPHWGTIVVGSTNRIGNYAVLHTSTCISDNGKMIGDGLYLSTGAKITSKVRLGDYISVAANSVVTKDFEGNALLVGAPAVYKMPSEPWFIRDGVKYQERIKRIEDLKTRHFTIDTNFRG